MFAKIIAIEGPDKIGKATQAKMLAHTLRRYGDKVAHVEIPWNDRLTHRLLYWMLHNGSAKSHPNVFQTVQFVNKFIFQCTYLVWLWLTCDFIILDRWRTSAIAYSIAARGNFYLTYSQYKLLIPAHLTCVLHGPAYKRKTVDDSYERDVAFQDAVSQAYFDWVELNPIDHELINNQGTKDDVARRLERALGRSLGRNP